MKKQLRLRGAERVFPYERARAQRGQESEEVKNREGVASGSATLNFIAKKYFFIKLDNV